MDALGTSFPVRTMPSSETEMSTTCQDYKSTSATAVTSSVSSLLKTQSSDLLENREDLNLIHRPSKTKAAEGQGRRSSKTVAAQGQGHQPSKTKAAQDQNCSSSQTEATQCSRQKPNKTKATRGPRQRFRKTKGAHSQSWGPRKAATQGQCWGLIRSSSKTKDFYDPSWSQGSSPSKTESWSQSTSPGSSKTEVTRRLSPSLRKPQTT